MPCYNCPDGGNQQPQIQRGINDVQPSFIKNSGRLSNSIMKPSMPAPSKAAATRPNKSLNIKKKSR